MRLHPSTAFRIHPYPYPYKEAAHPLPPHTREGTREPVACSRSLSPTGVPIKPCLNFLSGLLVISINLGGQELWSVITGEQLSQAKDGSALGSTFLPCWGGGRGKGGALGILGLVREGIGCGVAIVRKPEPKNLRYLASLLLFSLTANQANQNYSSF